VLFHVAANPHCTVDEIADELALTHRTVWGLIGDLRRARLLLVSKDGRRHRYVANLDAPFLHPSLEGYTLRTIISLVVAPLPDTAAIP
jgi:predicted transcriptional regulator